MDGFAGQVKAGPLISENYSNRHANVNKIGAEFAVFLFLGAPVAGAGDGIRTRDNQLGKLVFCH